MMALFAQLNAQDQFVGLSDVNLAPSAAQLRRPAREWSLVVA
jgi:hypothetical protein